MHNCKKNCIFAADLRKGRIMQSAWWITVILVIDILVFLAYELAVLFKFNIPNNLSMTYYHFDRRHRGYGWLFPYLLYFLSVTALPIWAYFTYQLPDWRSNMVFLPILTAICLFLVGVSARYKKSMARVYFHYTVAILAAVFAFIWFVTVGGDKLNYLMVTIISVMLVTATFTRTLRVYSLFWLESAAFFTVLFALLTISIVPEMLL